MPSLNTKLASAPNTQTNYVLKATSSTTIGNSLIQDDGTNVAIGTTPATYKLNVNGTLGVTGAATLSSSVTATQNIINTTSPTSALSIYQLGGANKAWFGVAGTGGDILNQAATGDLVIRSQLGKILLGTYQSGGSDAYAAMTIANNLNVGIGTTTPSSLLHILTPTGVNFQNAIRLEKAAGYGESVIQNYYTSTTNYGIGFDAGASGTAKMVINNSGNVGIGTSSPSSARLQVTPSANANSINLGSLTAPFFISSANTFYGLYMGVTSSGYGWIQNGRNDSSTAAYAIALNPVGGNVLIGTDGDNGIAALQINGGINTSFGYKYTYSLGTISQNTTITQSIPNNGAGFYLISNGGNNSALFMITRSGGSQGCQLVFSTNGNADIVCGTTTEPSGGNYLRLWMGSVGVLSIKNVNAYTGPYYITAICTF